MDNSLLKKSWLGAALLLVLFSLSNCKKDINLFNKGRQQKEINNLKAEIRQLAGSLSCENSADWKFVTLKEDACETPFYVAYSTKIDESLLLQKVAQHNEKQMEFNAVYNKNRACLAIAYYPPTGVECVNGKPKFVYR